MQELDKAAMGKRIRQIRLGARLRQWELAKLLGTTQSAVHKYEHGVVPEPRRLIELARIGGTSIEWVLTGNHWENGSREQERVSADLLGTACILREINEEGRATVNQALGIVRDAVEALESGQANGAETEPALELGALREHSRATLELLEAAARIQRAVLRRVTEDVRRKLDATPRLFERRLARTEDGPGSSSADRRSSS